MAVFYGFSHICSHYICRQNVKCVTFSTGNLICITILLCCRQRLNFAPAFSNLLTLLSLFYIFTLVADQTRNALNLKIPTARRQFLTNTLRQQVSPTTLHPPSPLTSRPTTALPSLSTPIPFSRCEHHPQTLQITKLITCHFRLPSPVAPSP